MKKHKNLRVVKELAKLRLSNLMMFRLGFFGPLFVDGSMFIIQLIIFQAIYSNVDMIGSWGKGEMIIFIGTFSMINGISMFICFFGLNSIPYKIKSGDMDLYLTKPVSPLLRFTFENINPGSFPLLILSALIVAYGVKAGDVRVTAGSVIAYVFWVLIMTVLYYEMEVIIRAVAFFVISTENINRIEDAGLSLCMQLPGIVFRGVFKIIFCVILPYGIMATIPVQSLVGELTFPTACYGIGAVDVFTVITAVLWRSGVRHYNSASS